MENNIKIGDTVRLKGQPNGPVMTVIKFYSNEGGQRVCVWFDKNHTLNEGTFLGMLLEKVENGAPIPDWVGPVLLGDRVQSQLDLIRAALLDSATTPERYCQFYAAQQALSWALNPEMAKPPYETISEGLVMPLPKEGNPSQAAQFYTLSDMEKCFNESRLTNPMVGFKHDSFEAFLAFQRKSNIPPVPDLGTEEGYFHWYTTSEGSDIKPLRAESLSREEVLRETPQFGMRSIFLVAKKSVPPKTWEEVWASITDIYENEDGAWVRRPLPAEKESDDEWHYIISVTELERQDSDKVWRFVFVQKNAGIPDEINWFKGKPSALHNATVIYPSNARIKKSDLK